MLKMLAVPFKASASEASAQKKKQDVFGGQIMNLTIGGGKNRS